MTLQNRVDPWGQLHANPAKVSEMMGNRGVLHDDSREIVRPWKGNTWLACDPGFEGIDRRPLFQANRYSELFFLDEATAFAAGHRPCADCQRSKFNAFKALWTVALRNGEQTPAVSAKEIDSQLHDERAVRGGKKVTFESTVASLPEGAMFEINSTAVLLYRGRQFRWGFEDYTLVEPVPQTATVSVLTPRSIVRLLSAGLTVRVHASADA